MKRLSAARLRSLCRDIGDRPRETAIGFDRYGRQVFRVEGGADEIEIANEDVMRLYDGTLIHNHPNGGTFSLLDLDFGMRYALAQLYAIGSRYVYRFDLSQSFYGIPENAPVWPAFRQRVNSAPRIEGALHEVYDQAWREFAAGFGVVYEVQEREA